jgi:hypothetical protein
MPKTGAILTTLGLAFLTGGMAFFGAIVAPLVFTQLPPDVAGPFIRTMFPFYYAYLTTTAVLATIGYALRRQRVSMLVTAGIAVVTLFLWFWLIQELDALRLAGNAAGFARGHTLSVWINGAQFLAALWLLVRTAV